MVGEWSKVYCRGGVWGRAGEWRALNGAGGACSGGMLHNFGSGKGIAARLLRGCHTAMRCIARAPCLVPAAFGRTKCSPASRALQLPTSRGVVRAARHARSWPAPTPAGAAAPALAAAGLPQRRHRPARPAGGGVGGALPMGGYAGGLQDRSARQVGVPYRTARAVLLGAGRAAGTTGKASIGPVQRGSWQLGSPQPVLSATQAGGLGTAVVHGCDPLCWGLPCTHTACQLVGSMPTRRIGCLCRAGMPEGIRDWADLLAPQLQGRVAFIDSPRWGAGQGRSCASAVPMDFAWGLLWP